MKKTKFLLSVITVICMLTSVLSGCSDKEDSEPHIDPEVKSLWSSDVADVTGGVKDGGVRLTEYIQPTQMPYYAEWVDKNYPRQKNVVVKNEGLSEYPVYGTNFKTTDAPERAVVYSENMRLTSGDTSFWGNTAGETPEGWPFYNMMDKDGNLLKINFGTAASPADAVDSGMDLYKHTASNGMYFGNVSDEEPAVVKRLQVNGKGYGTIVTGLYAPAGEVVEVKMSADSLRDRNIYISVGQTMGAGRANAIPNRTTKSYVRMPIISNRFRMNKQSSYYDEATDTYSFYIGSHLGGPIYLLTTNANSKSDTSGFSFTISGAVNYRHYILGVTTQEEFEYTSTSSAPYFDMEVSWMQGVRHSGPLKYAQMYDYEQLTDVAMLWEKIGMVSNQIPNWCNGGGNIIFTYDNYITAGDAFALTGHRNVVAPYGWMTSALNYNAFVTDGSWGNVHEYNHHYQKFGMSSDSNEIKNNAVNLLEYALFTDISSKRTLTGTASKEYWNAYTSPQYGLQYLLSENKKANDNGSAASKHYSLHVYSALLNNIGADAFIASARTGSNPAGYYKNLCNGTHLDMTYFFTNILNFVESDLGGADAVEQVRSKNYPVFVPVNTVYQVGRIWEKDGIKQYAYTARPFVYGTGNYTLDFQNYLVIPQDFDYEIAQVTQPENGSVTVADKQHINYVPDGNSLSGDFVVTLKVTKKDNAFDVDDVNLIINLQQEGAQALSEQYTAPSYLSHVYNYDHHRSYADGQTLIDSKFAKSVNDNPKYDGRVPDVYSLDNIFDDNDDNVFWSTGNTMGEDSYSQQNPFELTVDLGQTVTANTFTIYYPKQSNFDNYYCTHFQIYAGVSQDGMQLVHSVENAQSPSNRAMSVKFENPVELRYYKLVVTDATKRSDRQFAIRKLEWSYTVSGGKVISPEAKRVTYLETGRRVQAAAVEYTGEWYSKSAPSSFGTVKIGDGSSSAAFTFDGERIAVFSCLGVCDGTFEIYIDGNKVSEVNIAHGSGKDIMYMSGPLGEGKHTVTVKGKTGKFNIDSFVIFDN